MGGGDLAASYKCGFNDVGWMIWGNSSFPVDEETGLLSVKTAIGLVSGFVLIYASVWIRPSRTDGLASRRGDLIRIAWNKKWQLLIWGLLLLPSFCLAVIGIVSNHDDVFEFIYKDSRWFLTEQVVPKWKYFDAETIATHIFAIGVVAAYALLFPGIRQTARDRIWVLRLLSFGLLAPFPIAVHLLLVYRSSLHPDVGAVIAASLLGLLLIAVVICSWFITRMNSVRSGKTGFPIDVANDGCAKPESLVSCVAFDRFKATRSSIGVWMLWLGWAVWFAATMVVSDAFSDLVSNRGPDYKVLSNLPTGIATVLEWTRNATIAALIVSLFWSDRIIRSRLRILRWGVRIVSLGLVIRVIEIALFPRLAYSDFSADPLISGQIIYESIGAVMICIGVWLVNIESPNERAIATA